MTAQNHHQLVFPDDSRYDDARQAWNLAADLRPAVVALPTSAEDVVNAVQYAGERDLRIVVQGTGHGASVHAPLDGAMLVNMREMRRVEIDAAGKRARLEAGALWEDVVIPATEQGLTALHGSSPNVGVVGYSLGGGIGWMARMHGLSAESVLAVELVTADGALIRADRTQNTDLFWALRGGGGGLGVVVALEIALYEVDELVAGMMIWPWEQAAEVLTRYVEWAETAPNSVSASGRMLQIPPFPEIPEFIRGRQLVVINGAVLGTEAEADEILAPLRELGPEIDTFGAAPLDCADPAAHGSRAADARRRATASWSMRSTPTRSRRWSRSQGRARTRRFSSWSSVSSVVRCGCGSQVPVPWARWTVRSRSSPQACRWAPRSPRRSSRGSMR